jgi:hypothetical protein
MKPMGVRYRFCDDKVNLKGCLWGLGTNVRVRISTPLGVDVTIKEPSKLRRNLRKFFGPFHIISTYDELVGQ